MQFLHIHDAKKLSTVIGSGLSTVMRYVYWKVETK
jgi:hypothetical protein